MIPEGLRQKKCPHSDKCIFQCHELSPGNAAPLDELIKYSRFEKGNVILVAYIRQMV